MASTESATIHAYTPRYEVADQATLAATDHTRAVDATTRTSDCYYPKRQTDTAQNWSNANDHSSAATVTNGASMCATELLTSMRSPARRGDAEMTYLTAHVHIMPSSRVGRAVPAPTISNSFWPSSAAMSGHGKSYLRDGTATARRSAAQLGRHKAQAR